MIQLSNQQLQDFQEVVAWQTGMRLPDGRVLGVPGKRGNITDGLDPRVRIVWERLQPENKSILEFGVLEGNLTAQLAGICQRVVGLEIRPKNIAGALIRLFVHGVGNAQLRLQDVRDLDDDLGRFDIAFHVGVLYHLPDPVSHLARVAQIADDLVLCTHYAKETLPLPDTSLTWGGETYRGKVWPEGEWGNAFAGVEPTAVWLYQEDLLRLLRDLGYASVELVEDRQERNGPRLRVLARQRPTPAQAESAAARRRQLAAWKEALQARADLALVQRQHACVQQELDLLHRSWAMRLGKLMVAPLRPLRRWGRRLLARG